MGMVLFFMVGCQQVASNSNGKPSLQFRLSNRGSRECTRACLHVSVGGHL